MIRPAADAAREQSDQRMRERDFFLDELMTAQPDATREFMRAYLKQQSPLASPRRQD